MAYIKKMVMQGFKSFASRTEIPFDPGINVVIGPNGSGKSCSYDSVVTLADGKEVLLGELIEKKISQTNELKSLDDGVYCGNSDNEKIEIISLNKNTMKAEKKLVSRFIRREGAQLYRLKTRSGREIKATACHPIMAFSEGEVKSRLIGEMNCGFKIAVPRKIEVSNEKEDEEFSRLMGYIIGDGYIAKDRIEFVNKDKEVLEDFENLIVKRVKWGIRKRADGANKEVIRIYTRSEEFVKEIREFYGEVMKGLAITSQYKHIPNYFLTLGNKSIANLLAGLYDTDGSVRKDIGVIEYCTKNKRLSMQVQALLLRFGILSKIKCRKAYANNTVEKNKRDYYYIYITGVEELKKFYDNIPLRVGYKKETLKSHIDKGILSNPNVDLLPQEINIQIKQLVQLLGIKVKNIRGQYPHLAAYVEDRCAPSRAKINSLIGLFNEKLAVLFEEYHSLSLNQIKLVEFMDAMALSSRVVSSGIGLGNTTIRNQWASGISSARESNLEKFKEYLAKEYLIRISKIAKIMNLLQNIANSEIYWDEVVLIEKIETPKYVYDLTVEGNHNFIANNIFVHNSNISDALCFVLGRLSVKSMRAAKASNLIFMGSKRFKPAKEAWVEIVFDNSDKAFQSGKPEVVMKRIVRRNGQSIYKIDGETKTRTEVLEMLAHAGIDPHGFNLILQGQIQSVVRMHPEERRKIIEEVAGISIYESRKEKSLHELEKTDEKLKEVSTTLRERTSFLKNLEKEKQQAEKFRELEETVKRAKASLLNKKKDEKNKELSSIDESVEKKNKQYEEIKKHIEKTRAEIEKLNEEVNSINQHIRTSAGIAQESLHSEISGLKANCEGLRVKKESMEQRENEIENRMEGMKASIPEIENEIKELRVQSPIVAKKGEELKRKREILAQLEVQRKQIQTRKAELNNIRERIKEKEKQIGRASANEENVMKQMEELSKGFQYSDEKACSEAVKKFRVEIEGLEEKIASLRNEELKEEKAIAAAESVIERAVKVKSDVSSIDVCPLCQSKITEEHKEHVFSDCLKQTESGENIRKEANKRLSEIYDEKKTTETKIKEIERKLSESEFEIRKHQQVSDKKNQLRAILEETKIIQNELKMFENEQKKLEENVQDSSSLDEKYDATLLEIEEISARTSKDVDTSLLYKERDLERIKSIIEGNVRDLKELNESIRIVGERLEQQKVLLVKKEAEEKELNEKFKKLFEERELLQKKMQEQNHRLLEQQQESRQIEDQITYLKIGKAKLDAEIEAVVFELQEYTGLELLAGSVAVVEERLHKAQETLHSIGSINMRALEMYDEMKREYDSVQVKVDTLAKEKEEIMKIIAEIDLRKKKEFMRTFRTINELFSRNFGRISNKGEAYLEVENKEDIFAGGVNIVVKLAKGKYFDVSSLSGGEQTMVALSLLFAIQEHKPYHFYVFDEIDAALDKRNSERLADLLNQYMKAGQYIVVTHNDALIMNAHVLYGVSMHEGMSKILSLRLEHEEKVRQEEPKQEDPKENDESEEEGEQIFEPDDGGDEEESVNNADEKREGDDGTTG